MKVAIITLMGRFNCGNKLQNYAVQAVLNRHGCDACTIAYRAEAKDESKWIKIKAYAKGILYKLGITEKDFYLKYIEKNPREILFCRFGEKYIKTTKKYFLIKDKMKKYQSDFDYYSVGSDQVWNYNGVRNNDFFFLKFAPSHKTFSFSASMGTTNVPPEYIDNFIGGLNHVGSISVREDDARDFILRHTGRESTVLLDPTLLLSKEEWKSVANTPAFKLPERYIATYFLSRITESQRKYIYDYASKNNLPVIDMEQTYRNQIGPSEFVYIISNAEFIFTDSFHGTAFSIIFDKRFLAFQRNYRYDMSSRITTLLSKVRLENRFMNVENNEIGDGFYSLVEEIKKQDTSHVGEILEAEQNKADAFIKKALGCEE